MTHADRRRQDREVRTLRRTFLCGLTLSALAAPLGSEAQQAAKVARIGYLMASNLAVNPQHRKAFLQELRDRGYVEGRNLIIEYRAAEGKVERLPALAVELVALKVDVILAPSTVAAQATKQASTTVPVVSVTVPVTNGLVTSLARPAAMSRGWPSSPRSSSASAWSSSSRPCRGSVGSRLSGSPVATANARNRTC